MKMLIVTLNYAEIYKFVAYGLWQKFSNPKKINFNHSYTRPFDLQQHL